MEKKEDSPTFGSIVSIVFVCYSMIESFDRRRNHPHRHPSRFFSNDLPFHVFSPVRWSPSSLFLSATHNWRSFPWQRHQKWHRSSNNINREQRLVQRKTMSVTPPEAPPYPTTPEEDHHRDERATSAYAEILVRCFFLSESVRRNSFRLQTFQWAFGFNKDLPVLNVSINNTKKIFFAAAQIGVLYDFANNRQQLFIGHVTHLCFRELLLFNDRRRLLEKQYHPLLYQQW